MLLPCFCLAFQEMQQLTSTSGMHLQLQKADLKLPGLQRDLHLQGLQRNLHLPSLQRNLHLPSLQKDLHLPDLQMKGLHLQLPDLKLPQQKLTGLNLSFFPFLPKIFKKKHKDFEYENIVIRMVDTKNAGLNFL